MAKTPRTWTGARTPSGLKRVRQAARRHDILGPRRTAAKTYVAKALSVAAGPADAEATTVALIDALSALDRAAKAGAIHPNAAARRKSRLTIKINAALGGTQVATSGRVTKVTGKAAAAKAAKARIAAGKSTKAKGAQTAAGKARAALSKTARAEAAAAKAAAGERDRATTPRQRRRGDPPPSPRPRPRAQESTAAKSATKSAPRSRRPRRSATKAAPKKTADQELSPARRSGPADSTAPGSARGVVMSGSAGTAPLGMRSEPRRQAAARRLARSAWPAARRFGRNTP